MSGDGQQHERAQRTIDGRAAVAALLGVLAPVLAFLGLPVLGVPAALGGAVVLLLVAVRQLVPLVLSPMLMAPIPF